MGILGNWITNKTVRPFYARRIISINKPISHAEAKVCRRNRESHYNGIAGIQGLEPGFKKIKICPYLPESVHEFKCSYHSAAGEISVQVKEEQDGLVLQVKVPDGVEYQIDTTNLEGSREIKEEKIKVEVE